MNVVLATTDPVFAALFRRAFDRADAKLKIVADVPPAELLETVRLRAPELIVLDVDGQDVAQVRTLAAKVTLVSEARLVLVAGYLAPGSPGLCALLQSIAAGFVQKPDGASSLGLAAAGGPAFVAALEAALVERDDKSAGPRDAVHAHLPVDFDSGWNLDEAPPVARLRADDD
jgi:DNA-binding NarL/FixJ family response regulator